MIKKLISMILVVGTISSIGVISSAETTQGTTSTEQSISAKFTQAESVQLTLSSNSVDFGEVSGLSEVVKDNAITVTVSSSLPYNVTMKPSEDFKNGSSTISVAKMGLKVDSGDFSYFSGKDDIKSIVTSAPATYSNVSKNKSYELSFKLDKTIGEVSGTYTAPFTLSLSQN